MGCSQSSKTLHWRHNDHDGVSNHQPHDCLPNGLFRHKSKKTSKLRITGLCMGSSPGPVNSPHKGTVTRKMFPFDDVIMMLLKAERVVFEGALMCLGHLFGVSIIGEPRHGQAWLGNYHHTSWRGLFSDITKMMIVNMRMCNYINTGIITVTS